eukprot:6227661-Prorocentrum_lima.AAC.1
MLEDPAANLVEGLARPYLHHEVGLLPLQEHVIQLLLHHWVSSLLPGMHQEYTITPFEDFRCKDLL